MCVGVALLSRLTILFRRLAKPRCGLGEVPGHARARVVQVPEHELRVSVTLFSFFSQAAQAAFVGAIELRIGLALIRREVHRLHRYASALPVREYLFERLF